MGNNVLVLGANGFLGSYIKDHLDVIPITRKECDLMDENSVKQLIHKTSPDIIINCAGSSDYSMGKFELSEYQKNMIIFSNVYRCRDSFGKFINIGSGAEFDRSCSIDNVKEDSVIFTIPKDHYGLSKNTIANICLNTANFHTLRLFGCFNRTEPGTRLFKRLLTEKSLMINNRYFDYVAIDDFLVVLEYFLTHEKLPKDINVVYTQKHILKDLVDQFKIFHGLDIVIKYTESKLNYTGASEKLDVLNLNLSGLMLGLENY